jgi:hypothetical protein
MGGKFCSRSLAYALRRREMSSADKPKPTSAQVDGSPGQSYISVDWDATGPLGSAGAVEKVESGEEEVALRIPNKMPQILVLY